MPRPEVPDGFVELAGARMVEARPEATVDRRRRLGVIETISALAIAGLLLYADPVAMSFACGGAAAMTLSARRRPWLLELPVRSMFVLHGGLLLLCAWMVTQGSGRWLELEILSEAYDSLARHLLSGSAEVDAGAIRFEAWQVDGRSFMYFGPLPALFRVLPILLAPSLYGRLARAAVMLSIVGTLWGLSLLLRTALAGSTRLSRRLRVRLYVAGIAAIAVASPFSVVLSCAAIYNEAICWGFCAAVWALYFAWRLVNEPGGDTAPAILGLSFAAGAALLSRATFGIPAYAILAVLVLRSLARLRAGNDKGPAFVRICVALLPALAAGLFQLWYNDARFGSMWEAANSEVYSGSRPVGLEAAFHWMRIPSGLYAYFAIHPENFSTEAPWILYAQPAPLQPGLFAARTTPLISVLLTSPWTLVALWSGLRAAWSSPRRKLLAAWLACLSVQVVLILSYYWHGYRHTVDFLPLLVLLMALAFQELDARRVRIFVGTLVAAVVATSLSSLHFHSVWWTYRREHQAMAGLVIEILNALVAPFG